MSLEDPQKIEEARIPMKQRNDFQRYLTNLMFGDRFTPTPSGEWKPGEIEIFQMYAAKISKILDNPAHKKIRGLIMQEDYAEAASLVKEIREDDERMAA